MRVLIIGLGSIGQRHVRNLRILLGDQVELMAVRVRGLNHILTDTLQVEAPDGLCEKYGIRAFGTLEQALACKPEAAFICNPNSMHIGTALELARAGCHLFIEKPLAHEYAGVEELIEIVERKGLVATVGYQLRFHPCLMTTHRLLESNAIGPVLAVQAESGEYMPGWHTYEDYREAYAAHRAYGGGVLLAQIHDMDYLYWFFGLPRQVFALGGHLSSLELDVEDVASTLMQCEKDGSRFPVHLHQDYLQRPARRTCRIIGDRGKIEADMVGLTVKAYDGSGQIAESHEFRDFQRNKMFLEETRRFLASIESGDPPIVPLRDGFQSVRMALAARESLETGSVVSLSDSSLINSNAP
jgi:predicted dehydrogenase